MDATVGARIEVVTPRRWMTGADRGFLALLILVSVGLHGWLIGHTHVTSRDAMEFARLAINLQTPTAGPPKADDSERTIVDVLKETKHHPAHPAAVALASQIVRRVAPELSLPVQWATSTQVASAAAAVLLVLPMYWLGRGLFSSPFVGFAGALLFQVLPVVAHTTSDGLSEGLFLLCVATATLFAVRGLRKRSTFNFLVCGMASGAAYWVRPEGLMVVLAVSAVTTWLGLLKHWPMTVALGRMSALAVGLLLVTVPYMIAIGGISNKPSVIETYDKVIGNIKAKVQGKVEQPVVRTVLMADWYDPAKFSSKWTWAPVAIFKETFKATHYAPLFLGLFGLFWYRRHIVNDPGLAIVVVLGIVSFAVMLALALRPTEHPQDAYVSERHTLLLVMLCSIFAAASLKPLAQSLPLIGRGGAVGLLLALVLSALPVAVKPLHENRVGHYHAGRYLVGKVGPNDALVDPFAFAEWYAERSLVFVPDDPKTEVLENRWVIWEPTAGTKENPHSRLPRLEAARNVVMDTRNPPVRMYHWPENVPAADAKVVVYKQVVKSGK